MRAFWVRLRRFFKVKNLGLHRGRFLTDTDLKITANVCVLAAGAAQRLFGYEDPLDKDLLLGSNAYRVVGVLDQQSSGSERPGGGGQANFNNDIYIPITAARQSIRRTADDRPRRVDGV